MAQQRERPGIVVTTKLLAFDPPPKLARFCCPASTNLTQAQQG